MAAFSQLETVKEEPSDLESEAVDVSRARDGDTEGQGEPSDLQHLFTRETGGRNLKLGAEAITCYVHARTHRNEGKSLKYLAKVLWLLTYDTEQLRAGLNKCYAISFNNRAGVSKATINPHTLNFVKKLVSTFSTGVENFSSSVSGTQDRLVYEEELDVPLVLFNEVLDQLLRIDRIFQRQELQLLEELEATLEGQEHRRRQTRSLALLACPQYRKHLQLPVQHDILMQGVGVQQLATALRNPSNRIAHVAFRALGKFGGGNRKMRIEPQALEYVKQEGLGLVLTVVFPEHH